MKLSATVCLVVGVVVVCGCNTDPGITASKASGPGSGPNGSGSNGSGGGGKNGSGSNGSGGGADFFRVADAGQPPPGSYGTAGATKPKECTNLCKQQMKCANGGDTTLSGTVYAPTPAKFGAADPIYNAIVYVPNEDVAPFNDGINCDRCAAPSGSPVTAVLTGPDGKFKLPNVPVGDNIPLVIQVGRWRRQVKIPKVAACSDTAVPADLSRLPRNQSEGDIPLTAIASGNADALECVLRKIGIDESEFSVPGGKGRIHMFKNNGSFVGNPPPATDLTGNVDTLNKYNMVLLECEGTPIEKGPDKDNLVQYSNKGGRLFVTHYEYTYLYKTLPFNMVSDWKVNQGRPTNNDAPITGIIDQTFPKGMAFAQWLDNVKATSGPGQIQIFAPRHDADTVVPPTQRWVYTQNPNTIQQFTFNTPVGMPDGAICGRVLFSDFHVSDIKNISVQFPMECNDKPMTAQEKVLEFLLFDLASCIQPDDKPPMLIP